MFIFEHHKSEGNPFTMYTYPESSCCTLSTVYNIICQLFLKKDEKKSLNILAK